MFQQRQTMWTWIIIIVIVAYVHFMGVVGDPTEGVPANDDGLIEGFITIIHGSRRRTCVW